MIINIILYSNIINNMRYIIIYIIQPRVINFIIIYLYRPRDYRATASNVQMSHFPPKKLIEHSNQNTSQKFLNIQHYFKFDIV